MCKKNCAQADATVPKITLNCKDYFVLTDSMFYLAFFYYLFCMWGKVTRKEKKNEKNENSQAFGSLLFYSPMCHSIVLRSDEN